MVDRLTAGGGESTSEAPARRLMAALADVGIACRVDARGTAAFLSSVDDTSLARLGDDVARREAVALGRSHGFTHVALVVGDG